MDLGYIIIYVVDVKETVSFYEKAFGLEPRSLHESEQYAEMETGQTALAFVHESLMSHSFRPNRKPEQPAGVEIALVAQDVERHFKRAVDAGATELAKPVQKPWGLTVAYVRDNNGFTVELCSPING